MSLPRAGIAILVLAAFSSWGCGGARAPAPGPRGTVRFACEPEDAVLEVDETRLGPVGMFAGRGLLLAPGEHRVVLRAPGHFPEYRLIEVVEDELLVVEISLRPVPD